MTSVSCAACGASILAATAARHDGLCVPCSRGLTTTCRRCGGRAFRSIRGVETGGFCARCRIEQERLRPTQIRSFTADQGDCSLLVRLFELDERLRRQSVEGWIGLNLVDPPTRYDSDATPRNSIAFAATAGEDVHFSLVSVKRRVSDTSPVVLTVPRAGKTPWEANFVVGESLHEFLSLGCRHGYAELDELAYDREAAIAALEAEPEADDRAQDEGMLRVFREELGLRPWPSVRARLESLERRKRFILSFGADWLGRLRR